jgi:hypothetical protein
MPTPHPVFLFMLAGAMLAGGGALLDDAKRSTARREALDARRHRAELIEAAVREEDLRAEARARGLDPELVIQGAVELGSARLTVDDVIAFLDAPR